MFSSVCINEMFGKIIVVQIGNTGSRGNIFISNHLVHLGRYMCTSTEPDISTWWNNLLKGLYLLVAPELLMCFPQYPYYKLHGMTGIQLPNLVTLSIYSLNQVINQRTPFHKILFFLSSCLLISSSILLVLSIIAFKCSMLRQPLFLELYI